MNKICFQDFSFLSKAVGFKLINGSLNLINVRPSSSQINEPSVLISGLIRDVSPANSEAFISEQRERYSFLAKPEKSGLSKPKRSFRSTPTKKVSTIQSYFTPVCNSSEVYPFNKQTG